MEQHEKISQTPFPNSKKVYIKGKLFPIEVAMREITLSDTKLASGGTEKNHLHEERCQKWCVHSCR